MKETRILFMGTPEIAKEILKCLLDNNYNVVATVTQEDKEVGRKRILTYPPVKQFALQHNIKVFQPHKIRLDYEFVKDLDIDLLITCAYGQILPQGLLDIPRIACINIHTSLLPKYRGASPIQEALKQGDKETGVTIMEMIDKMDAGDIYLQKKIAIDQDDNYTTLLEKMTSLAKEAILEALPKIIENPLDKIKQDESKVSFCKKILKEDEHLSLELSKEEFINHIRMLAMNIGGYLYLRDEVFKIYKAKIVSSEIIGKVGEIIKADKNGLYLQLKDGIISLEIVQKQGKNILSFRDYLNGDKHILNEILK